ncbi:MAG: hypothetical protein AB1757_10625 [Acidobacteriota bacterium]
MVKRKTTRITVTKEEVWVLRQPTGKCQLWCEECAGEVEMVAAEKAAAIIKVSARALYRAVENQQLHFKETTDGRLLVCLNSLERFVNDHNRALLDTET